jgi:HSP20 family protein
VEETAMKAVSTKTMSAAPSAAARPATDPSADVQGFTTFPAVSVSDDGELITVTAELPGVEEGDIEVSAEGDVLMIRGEKRDEHHGALASWFRVERSYGSFLRRIDLPSAVDIDRAAARLEQGVLTMKLPKIAGMPARTRAAS